MSHGWGMQRGREEKVAHMYMSRTVLPRSGPRSPLLNSVSRRAQAMLGLGWVEPKVTSTIYMGPPEDIPKAPQPGASLP